MLGEKSSGENLSRSYVLRVAAHAKDSKGEAGSAVPTEPFSQFSNAQSMMPANSRLVARLELIY